MTDQTDPSWLIRQAALGDKGAMRKIYLLYADPLKGFVHNFLSDPVEAADIVHETMLEVWRNAARFEGRSSVKSWIFGIARNKSVDRTRRALERSSRRSGPRARRRCARR